MTTCSDHSWLPGGLPERTTGGQKNFGPGRAEKKLLRAGPGRAGKKLLGPGRAEKFLFGPGRAGRENVLGQATEQKKHAVNSCTFFLGFAARYGPG